MAKKLVRLYYSTYIDVEVETKNESDVLPIARDLALDAMDGKTALEHMCWEEVDSEITDID